MKLQCKLKALSIRHQVLFLLMGLIVPLMLIFTYIAYNDQKNGYFYNMESHARTNLQTTAMLLSDQLVIENYSQMVQNMLNILKVSSHISYIYIEKKDDSAIIFVKNNKWQMLDNMPDKFKNIANEKEFRGKLIEEKKANIISTIYHTTSPLFTSGFQWGWIHAGFNTAEYEKSIKELLRKSVIFVCISLLSIFAISVIISELILSPILKLTDFTKKVAAGDLNVRSDISGSREVEMLSRNFDEMVEQVREAREYLNETNLVLEEKVKLRTKELEDLNKNLDLRIKNEVGARRQQENLLIHQSRLAAMGEMIGNIAHQWRQPLNALGLTIQNVQVAYENDYLDEEYIAHVIQKSKRLTSQMSQTIDDFRDFFKPAQHKEEFNVYKCIMQSIEIIKASFRNNNIEIKIEVDEKLQLKGYGNQFSQVILNLLNNAKDAFIENNIKNRIVWIKTKQDKDIVALSIEDNGGGIVQDVLEHIFEPYYTTKEQGKGTGIGLYMSKMIIERNMGGRLMAKNTDVGAKFKIEMNIHKEEE